MRRADLRTWALGTKASPPARHVYHALSLFASSEGYAWPSVPTLVAVTGLGQATVRRALAELTTLGDLYREKRPGHADRYTLAQVIHSAHSEHPNPAHTEHYPAQSERAPRSQRAPKVVSKGVTKDGAPPAPRSNRTGGGAENAPLSPTTDSDGTNLPGSGRLRWVRDMDL